MKKVSSNSLILIQGGDGCFYAGVACAVALCFQLWGPALTIAGAAALKGCFD